MRFKTTCKQKSHPEFRMGFFCSDDKQNLLDRGFKHAAMTALDRVN